MHPSAFGQYTKQNAIDLVVDTIAYVRLDSVNIYMETQLQTGDYYVISPYDSIDSPYVNYWLVFIDEKPLFLWDHLCTYIFINSSNGNYTTGTYNAPPIGYNTSFDSVSVAYEITAPVLNYSSAYSETLADENEHYYAVIFSGYGQNIEPLFWNHLSHMYCALIEKGFPEDNIYALVGNGTDDSTSWGNESLNLDNDFDDDILNVPCTVANLDSIFSELVTKLTEDDLLFIFTSTHGSNDSAAVGDSYLKLYNYEKLWDDTLSAMLEEITCSQMIIPIYACHSGGFVDDLEIPTKNEKRTVFTATSWAQPYARDQRFSDVYGMDKFPYFLITAFRGYHPEYDEPWDQGYPIGEHPKDTIFPFPSYDNLDFHPDTLVIFPDTSYYYGNEDGVIQIGEVINYTKAFDLCFRNFGVIDYDCGFKEDLLSLTGISGNIDTTQTVTGNFIVGGNLTLNDSISLTVDEGSKFFLVNGDLDFEAESELILEDSLLFKNFQTSGSMNVYGGFAAGKVISFESIESTTLTLRFENEDLEPDFSDCDFKNVAFYAYTDTVTIDSSSTFTKSRIKSAEHLTIDDVSFDESTIALVAPSLSTAFAEIKNCSFSLAHSSENSLISLYRYVKFDIADNTFENYEESYGEGKHSVAIEYSGTTGASALNVIDGNTFTSEENEYSHTNGIMLYSSIADINDNDIQDQRVGVMLAGTSQTELVGTRNFCNESTQVIKNNNQYQVYASENSFPTYFTWNVVYHDTLTKYFVLHDLTSQNYDTVDVSNNYWSYKHDPDSNLLPIGHFKYEPIYDPCSKSGLIAGASDLYQTGVDYIENGNYSSAKNTFKTLISSFPKTEHANFSMKDIFQLEPLTENNFASLKTWYLNEDSIIGNERLKKLGENLANKCDEQLDNYETAIDWYEDIIEDPPSLQDSIFAIIDLENCYFQMGIDTNLKVSYCGKMPQFKLNSVRAHLDHRDELLALLLKSKLQKGISDDNQNDFERIKPGKLYQNVPNPFKRNSQIPYELKNESYVQLVIYTYTGRMIKTINEGTKTKGTHVIDFDASGLKSGIYFYSMNINGKTIDSKKMVILK